MNTEIAQDSIFAEAEYVPNAKDAAPSYAKTIVPVGKYTVRMVKSERRYGKVNGEEDKSKIKHYAELVIEEGEHTGKRLFTHTWIKNTDTNAKNVPKHEQGRRQFSVMCMEWAKQNGEAQPKHERDLEGWCYHVKVTVSEDKGTGEKSNWVEYISGDALNKGRDVGTTPTASSDDAPF